MNILYNLAGSYHPPSRLIHIYKTIFINTSVLNDCFDVQKRVELNYRKVISAHNYMRGDPGEEVGQLSALSFSAVLVDADSYLSVHYIGLHYSPHPLTSSCFLSIELRQIDLDKSH